MVLLESLNLPSLTPAVLALFASRGIITVEDFVVHELHTLSAVAEQSSVSAEFKETVVEILSYLEKLQDSWCDGFELSQREVRYLSLGCESIDNLLQGGMQEGTLTELVGASSTGKTQVCLQAAAYAAYKLQCSVIYVDTCAAFSPQRVAHMLGGILGSLFQVEEQRNQLTLAMRSIERIALFDIFAMLTFLQDLYISLQAGPETRLRLLIIDSVSSVISPVLGGNHSQGHALMVSVSQILKKLATTHRLAVLMTNHTVAGDGGQPKPALGGSWKSVPHTRLLLSHDSPSSDLYRITILKHTSTPCNKQAVFRIGRAGLELA